jgi:hypothetical protein
MLFKCLYQILKSFFASKTREVTQPFSHKIISFKENPELAPNPEPVEEQVNTSSQFVEKSNLTTGDSQTGSTIGEESDSKMFFPQISSATDSKTGSKLGSELDSSFSGSGVESSSVSKLESTLESGIGSKTSKIDSTIGSSISVTGSKTVSKTGSKTGSANSEVYESPGESFESEECKY